MYELEPAPGVKASRVIQLADDVARNMSALSARIATIPGRTVIGIELPNVNRESVVLHELISSEGFADQNAQLPIILGKNINGDRSEERSVGKECVSTCRSRGSP